jgi:hypothetical protein
MQQVGNDIVREQQSKGIQQVNIMSIEGISEKRIDRESLLFDIEMCIGEMI